MTKQADSLNRLRIAAPCPARWEEMKGTDEVRFCAQCELNVYNISALTRAQAAALIAQTEGRLCARFYRRADGTILTQDCPTGLRALRRRMVKLAGAAATAVMSLCLSAAGQTPSAACQPDSSKKQMKLTRIKVAPQAQSKYVTLSGKLTDPIGAVITGGKVVLVDERTKTLFTATSDDSGDFHFPLLEPGSYTLKIEAKGFQLYQRKQINIRNNETTRLDVTLGWKETTVEVGFAAPALIDTTTPGGTTVITSEMIQRLPHED